jgi:hypothetical protein
LNDANNTQTDSSVIEAGAGPTVRAGARWWRAEGSGEEFFGGPPAANSGGAGYGAGLVGQGFLLDGVDDRVTVPDDDSLDFGPEDDFTVELWFRTSSSQLVHWLVDKRNASGFVNSLPSDGAAGYSLFLYDGHPGFQMGVGPSDSPRVLLFLNPFNAADLRDGEWHHVAARVERGKDVQLWADGVLLAATSVTAFRDGSVRNDEPLRIGHHATAVTDGFHAGAIDEVIVHRRAIAADEISATFFARAAGHARAELIVLPSSPAFAGATSTVPLVGGRSRIVSLVVSNAGP